MQLSNLAISAIFGALVSGAAVESLPRDNLVIKNLRINNAENVIAHVEFDIYESNKGAAECINDNSQKLAPGLPPVKCSNVNYSFNLKQNGDREHYQLYLRFQSGGNQLIGNTAIELKPVAGSTKFELQQTGNIEVIVKQQGAPNRKLAKREAAQAWIPTTYKVNKGETLLLIAQKVGIPDWNTLWDANKQITDPWNLTEGWVIYIPVEGETPSPTNGQYVVIEGETLSSIAKKFNVTLEFLLSLNGQIANPDYIQTGWVINIPTLV